MNIKDHQGATNPSDINDINHSWSLSFGSQTIFGLSLDQNWSNYVAASSPAPAINLKQCCMLQSSTSTKQEAPRWWFPSKRNTSINSQDIDINGKIVRSLMVNNQIYTH